VKIIRKPDVKIRYCIQCELDTLDLIFPTMICLMHTEVFSVDYL